jgi:hypothetical protein
MIMKDVSLNPTRFDQLTTSEPIKKGLPDKNDIPPPPPQHETIFIPDKDDIPPTPSTKEEE